jgi:oligoribonuclease (3'-5' exoribonuclease)
MSSPYIAIDIETTGLDPYGCQILEIGAVYNDPECTLMDCPTFEAIVDPSKDDGTIRGSAYALAMNAELLKFIAECDCWSVYSGVDKLMEWVDSYRVGRGIAKFHLLGKNVGGFDRLFLERIGSWRERIFHYRCLEVGSMYATPEGVSGQAELLSQLERQYEIPGKEHTALHDARVSLALARNKWGIDS